MKNIPYLSSMFLHMILTVLVAGDDSPPAYPPGDVITIKCGSMIAIACGHTGPQILDDRSWTGDRHSIYSEERQAGNTSITREAPLSSSSSASQVPYTRARLSRFEFTYRFSFNTTGQKFIRLYFYPASYPDFNRSQALFSVKAGGFTLLHNFNASAIADVYGEETLYREFCLNIDDQEQSLNITFTPTRAASPDAYAFINGIEIVDMPSNLYYTESQSPSGVSYVGTRGKKFLRIENNTALEMVYRLNIGGDPISDTGLFFRLYRNWDGVAEEENYLDALSLRLSGRLQSPSVSLNFSIIREYTAPLEVYQTGRSGSRPEASARPYNLTWEFPVDSKFSYLVRMHFCEFQSDRGNRNGSGDFQIYIANQTAEERANIFLWSGGYGIPVYRDYVVSMVGPESMHGKTNLSIALNDLHSYATLNGLEVFKLNDSNGNLGGLNPSPPPSEPVEPQSPSTARVLGIAAGLVSGILVTISVLGFFIFMQRRKAKSSSANNGTTKLTKIQGPPVPLYLCPYFSLADIKAATENFNVTFIIGVGGFGTVYRGCIGDGVATSDVAIKRLKPNSSQGVHEFKTEIELLSQLRHRHLVSLIGYCTDEYEMILVYDYMPRGTLASHLYHTNKPALSWEQRLLICIGTARGLQYLHSEAKSTIIHRDVKSTNILLDEKWVAKVSDFGLSKMGMTTMSKTHISTAVKGSFGYLDPEYYRRRQLTEKSDVYSFGVVLWEVLCGRPSLMHTVETRRKNLAEWAKSCHGDGTLDQIIDRNLKGKIEPESLNKFIEIAMSCIHDKGIERPSMNEVVRGLELALQLHRKSIGSNADNEVTFLNDGGVSTEQGFASNESVQCISATIFSEINDPIGR
ncbi:receptor-like protein kinase FERONIA isoform X1 [Malus sylvestris]|uniref:receptor-like protein kinase FERONIA isoform X1 n=1 Tax=Malus sylvestris TaxID=3752 RepID=UPI0021AC5A2B|nr:receptor-like protein kinase FERONIA isoform X1 [Malus sylvestris]